VSTTVKEKKTTNITIHTFHMGQVLYSSTVPIINNIRTGNTTIPNTVGNFTGEERQSITKVKD
jgi:hypothetical protein